MKLLAFGISGWVSLFRDPRLRSGWAPDQLLLHSGGPVTDSCIAHVTE